MLRPAMVLFAGAILLSCAQPPAPGESAESAKAAAPPVHAAPAPAVTLAVPGTLNRMPSLAVSRDRVAAVWTSTLNDVMDVYAAVSDDGGRTFSEPRRVNDRPGDARSNAEQPPRVVMSEAAMTVIWPSREGSRSVIRQARSTDGGRTFSPATSLQSPSVAGVRGWQSLSLGRDGAVHAVWLDGRDADPSKTTHHHHATAKAAAPAPREEGAPRQDVYQAVIAPDGTISEAHVARDVCYCCKTAVGVGPSGRVSVAWRHIFPESMRDIAMATSTDGGRTFGPLARVSEDRWQLSGCPDDGPSMAVDDNDAAHLVWPTLVNQTTPQKAVFYTSTKDGRTFGPRVRLSSPDQEDAAHPQIAVAEGNAGAVWDEQHGDTRRIVMRISTARSGGFGAQQVLSDGGSAFHPYIAAAPGGFLVAWPAGNGERSSITVQRVTF